jgi:CPA2 family monovalent cation:H+ antiporter-2
VNPLWLILAAIPILVLVSRSNTLAGHYLEIEARFLANFNERKLAGRFGQSDDGAEAHHWLTEQLYVGTLRCPNLYVEDGRSLKELDWGNQDHVKIIKILRGREHLNIPEGHVKVRHGDLLVVMGAKRAVENFQTRQALMGLHPPEGEELITLKTYIESQEGIPEARQLLCCGVTLESSMPQEGKSIRASGIKEEWSAFLIGLERDLLPIPNPDPNMNLRSGDLLWVMGSQEMASKLMRMGLLD